MNSNDELIDRWIDYMESLGRARKTLLARRCHIRTLAVRVELATATEDDVLELFRARNQYSAETLHQLHVSLRCFYRWAGRRGLVDNDPTLDIPGFKVPDGVPRPIDENSLHIALGRAQGKTRLALLLGAFAGLRIAEIAGLHSDNITPLGLIVTGKGGKTRRVPIHPILAPELDGIVGWAFPSPRWPDQPASTEWIAQRLKQVLPKPFTAHSLRHRFATRAYSTTRDLRVVQTLLGHTSADTTQRYVAIYDDELSAAVNLIAA